MLDLSKAAPLHPRTHPSGNPACRAFGFVGQGSQSVGMGGEIYNDPRRYPVYRRVFDEGCAALKVHTGVDLHDIVFNGPIERLTETQNAQPAMGLTGYAWFRQLLHVGMQMHESDMVMGHSAAEIAAYAAAGYLTTEQLVLLLYWRGQAMVEAVPAELVERCRQMSPMRSVRKIDPNAIQGVCEAVTMGGQHGLVSIGNINSPNQTVISGDPAAVLEAAKRLEGLGAQTLALPVALPFHTLLMKDAADVFAEKIDMLKRTVGLTFDGANARCQVVANVSGRVIAPGAEHVASLKRQIYHPVLWLDCLRTAFESGAIQLVQVAVTGLLSSPVLTTAQATFDHTMPVEVVNGVDPLIGGGLLLSANAVHLGSRAKAPEEVDENVLRRSVAAGAAALHVSALMKKGRPEAVQRALLVLENRDDLTRDAGLHVLRMFVDQHPAIQARADELGLAWPPPPVRDLEVHELPEKLPEGAQGFKGDNLVKALERDIFQKLVHRGVAPIFFEDLLYYVQTRSGGDSALLARLLNELLRAVGLSDTRFSKATVHAGAKATEERGITDFRTFISFVDLRMGFVDRYGCLTQSEVEELRASQAAEGVA